jgi:hypothetical protein
MSFKLAEAFYELTVKDNKFKTAVDSVRKQVTALHTKMEALGRVANRMLMVGGGGMGLFVKMGADAERQANRLESALAATNGAAGVTADELKKLATDLQRTTTFEDDATVGAMAMMATFKNIKGDVFKRAIASAQDLSIAMGTDLQSSTRMLALALDNPAEGLAALSRAGVRFTESEKKSMDSMVATGNAAKAQELILSRLQSRFGGMAAKELNTFSGQMVNLKNKMGDLAEEVGQSLFPVLSRMGKMLGEIVDKASGLSNESKRSIANWTLFGASLLGVAAVTPKVIAGLSSISAAVVALGGTAAAGGVIGILVVGLAALGAAWLSAKAKGQSFGEYILELTNDITGLENAQSRLNATMDKEKKSNNQGATVEELASRGDKEGYDKAIAALQAELDAAEADYREKQAKAPPRLPAGQIDVSDPWRMDVETPKRREEAYEAKEKRDRLAGRLFTLKENTKPRLEEEVKKNEAAKTLADSAPAWQKTAELIGKVGLAGKAATDFLNNPLARGLAAVKGGMLLGNVAGLGSAVVGAGTKAAAKGLGSIYGGREERKPFFNTSSFSDLQRSTQERVTAFEREKADVAKKHLSETEKHTGILDGIKTAVEKFKGAVAS